MRTPRLSMLVTTIALAAAAPSVSADVTVPSPAHVVLDQTAARPTPTSVAADAATYASREANDRTVAKFRGGSAVLIIGGSGLAVVLLVVLLLVLL